MKLYSERYKSQAIAVHCITAMKPLQRYKYLI